MEGLVAQGQIKGRGWEAGRKYKEQGAVAGHTRTDWDVLSGQNAETTRMKSRSRPQYDTNQVWRGGGDRRVKRSRLALATQQV